MIICRTHLTTQLFHSQPPNPCPQNSYPSPLLNRSPFQKKTRRTRRGEARSARDIATTSIYRYRGYGGGRWWSECNWVKFSKIGGDPLCPILPAFWRGFPSTKRKTSGGILDNRETTTRLASEGDSAGSLMIGYRITGLTEC